LLPDCCPIAARLLPDLIYILLTNWIKANLYHVI
jgi:hypothetical protein